MIASLSKARNYDEEVIERRVDIGATAMAQPARLRKLAIFLADLEGGGAERMMVVIANGLVERGVKVDLLVASRRGPYLQEVGPRVNLIDLASGGVARAVPSLVSYLRRTRPDLLLTTLAHSSVAAATARSLAGTGVPLVLREANTPTANGQAWSSLKSRLANRLVRQAYRAADGVIAVSQGVANALREVVGVDDGKLAVLYNPVVSEELDELATLDPRHPWFANGQPPVVLGVGSLTPRKDFATLIRAFAVLRRQRPVKLILLGEGTERRRLERLVDELGLGDWVDLPGFVSNPFAFMARAGVYVLSSNLEGLPGSLIQALACGCPSVATDCPSGPREILQDGRVGPLVPIGDAGAMATAIATQLDDPPARSKLIQSVERYEARTVLGNLHAYLTEVVATRGRPSSRQG